MATTQLPYLLSDAGSAAVYRSSFDQTAFPFRHRLHESGYFSFEALRDLADRVTKKPNRWYVEEGDTTPGRGWSTQSRTRTLLENLDSIGEVNSLVMLKRVHEDPDYRPILDALEEELSELTGIDIPSQYRDGLMTVLITSPHRTTPYHIDGEANLLMQISGSKMVYIFDGNNREVLPTRELEAFWAGDIKASVYKEQLQDRAWEFFLVPGGGVSNPVTFPHWVKNGPEVSISVSVNFKRRIDNSADAYRVNHQLRKLGLRPTEPGAVKAVDVTKGLVYRTARKFKQGLAGFSSKSA